MRLKMKNGSHRYEINRTRPKHGHRYTKYKMCLSMIMVMCNKQHRNGNSDVICFTISLH